MTRLLFASLAISTLFACAGDKAGTDDTAEGDADTDADTDSDTDADSDADTDSDADADAEITSFVGFTSFIGGYDNNKDVYDDLSVFECALIWDTVGTASSVSCDNCEWALDFTLTYDRVNSNNTGGCLADETNADYQWTMGYDSGFYYGAPVMMYYNATYAEWSLVFYARIDGAKLLFYEGSYFAFPTTYNDKPYYRTNGWIGYGDLN